VHYPVAMTETDAERFRQEADECRRLAERSASQLDKEAWLRLAADWIKLATSLVRRTLTVYLERSSQGRIGGIMPRYFFDFHDAKHVTVDDVGEELPSLEAAQKIAAKAVGDAIRDHAHHSIDGAVTIEIRDVVGPVLRVFGSIVTKPVS
jgi:hypothetical protein